MLDYRQCKALMATARNKGNGKPLGDNTRLYESGREYVVVLYSTEIVRFRPDGSVVLNMDGRDTRTTNLGSSISAGSGCLPRNTLGMWNGWARPNCSSTGGVQIHRSGICTRRATFQGMQNSRTAGRDVVCSPTG